MILIKKNKTKSFFLKKFNLTELKKSWIDALGKFLDWFYLIKQSFF
jgi:hypothetical protein